MAAVNTIWWWLVIAAYFFGPPCILSETCDSFSTLVATAKWHDVQNTTITGQKVFRKSDSPQISMKNWQQMKKLGTAWGHAKQLSEWWLRQNALLNKTGPLCNRLLRLSHHTQLFVPSRRHIRIWLRVVATGGGLHGMDVSTSLLPEVVRDSWAWYRSVKCIPREYIGDRHILRN